MVDPQSHPRHVIEHLFWEVMWGSFSHSFGTMKTQQVSLYYLLYLFLPRFGSSGGHVQIKLWNCIRSGSCSAACPSPSSRSRTVGGCKNGHQKTFLAERGLPLPATVRTVSSLSNDNEEEPTINWSALTTSTDWVCKFFSWRLRESSVGLPQAKFAPLSRLILKMHTVWPRVGATKMHVGGHMHMNTRVIKVADFK